jgi:peptidyl-prolyl cis-trans isomerase A (cyclophilin A)
MRQDRPCNHAKMVSSYSMVSPRISLCLVLLSAPLIVTAQNVPPTVISQVGDFTEFQGAPAKVIDLFSKFADPDVPGTAVRITTVLGNIDLAFFDAQTPITVTNFRRYIDEGHYSVTDPTTGQPAPIFFHRSVPGFVIQSGGFLSTVNPSNPSAVQATAVVTFPPIQNEPGISNKRGTIAMAKQGGDANSATSQWFINLADNSANLDGQNGGFTVFGRVLGAGMSVADAIAAVPRFNFGSPFDELPLLNYSGTGAPQKANLVLVPSVAVIRSLQFSATSDHPEIATAAVSGGNLFVTGKQPGTAHISVTATDLDGGTVSQNSTVSVIAAPGRAVNISTRLRVGTDDDVMIGGFILGSGSPKRVLIRAIGPSLEPLGVASPLADPTLDLLDQNGTLMTSNDNWESAPNKQEIIDSTLAPTNPSESAILTTLPANTSYTAIVRGVNRGTGVGRLEVFDLDSGPGSLLLNISTRGNVLLNDDVMIGGFIVGGSSSQKVLVRAIGPSLATSGVANALNDPTLDLVDGQGTTVDSNNDWQSNPNAAQIEATTLAPSNSRESAVLDTLTPGNYTAIVRGTGNTPTGVGLVEVYALQ